MKRPNLYVEQPVRKLRGFIKSDELYSQAQDAFVLDCVDFIAIERKGRVFYLPKRKVHSAIGVWRFGGRRKAGESMEEALVRIAQRELTLTVDPKRFKYLTGQDTMWPYRQQAPQEGGQHCFIHLFVIEFTKEELRVAASNLDQKEYDVAAGLKKYNRTRLIKDKAYPHLIDAYELVFPANK